MYYLQSVVFGVGGNRSTWKKTGIPGREPLKHGKDKLREMKHHTQTWLWFFSDDRQITLTSYLHIEVQ